MTKKLKNKSKQEIANELLEEGLYNLEYLGIETALEVDREVRITNARSYFGQVKTVRGEFGLYYKISISRHHFKNGVKAVRDTIYHELIHCLGIRGHGADFQEQAHEFDLIFDTDIRTSSSYKGCKLPATDRKIKYILECKKCGASWKRKNKSKLIKNYKHYHCRCGGELERIK